MKKVKRLTLKERNHQTFLERKRLTDKERKELERIRIKLVESMPQIIGLRRLLINEGRIDVRGGGRMARYLNDVVKLLHQADERLGEDVLKLGWVSTKNGYLKPRWKVEE